MLATKVFFPMGSGPNDGGLSRKHIMDSIDASLRRLDTDFDVVDAVRAVAAERAVPPAPCPRPLLSNRRHEIRRQRRPYPELGRPSAAGAWIPDWLRTKSKTAATKRARPIGP